MSTAGIYGYFPKVEHPDKMFMQSEPDTHQPPFFFGGSQVPVNLHIPTGSGIRTAHKFSYNDRDALSTQGRGIHTTVDKNNKIMLPQYMSSIRR